jgi:transglutaminase-like putative cysteine protease
MADTVWRRYLDPTYIIDADSELVDAKARELTTDATEPVERARRLFYWVRDAIRYNIWTPKGSPELFRASATILRGEGYCVQKAVVMVALARAAELPARLGFAAIKNYSLPAHFLEIVKENRFPWHGYAQLLLNGRWVKATPAFDAKMCAKSRIRPVEFDGHTDACFHACNLDGTRHIEYLKDRGPFDDVPLDLIWLALHQRGLLR